MFVRLRLAVLAVLAAGGAAFGGYYLWPSARHIATCPAPVPAEAQKVLAAYHGRIRHDVRAGYGGRNESWYDPATGRSRDVPTNARG